MPPSSSHDHRRPRRSGGLFQDCRFAWRALKRRPTFAVIAIATLALGIGLNTSMFSLANSLLLRPLPFPDAGAIVRLYRATPDNQYGDFSPADYLSLRAEEPTFGPLAAYRLSNLAFDQASGAVQWMLASSEIFDVLGVQPAIGRAYTPDEERLGARVAVISDRLWQSQFGGSRDVIGRMARAGDRSYEIVGVLPAKAHDHRLFGRVGIFSPLAVRAGSSQEESNGRLGIIGRRNKELSSAQGDAFLSAAGARIEAARPGRRTEVMWRSEGLPLSTTGPTGKLLVAMLIGLATCVLLIACSNLANVLLASAIERRRESAVRAALGASRLQLVRPLLIEALLLAAAGGVAAMAVAIWTSAWLRTSLTDAGGIELPLDWRVLSFAGLSCVLTAAVVGLAPGVFALRTDPNVALGAGSRTVTSGARQRRLRNLLIAAQFTLATVLLSAAGTFLSGTANLLSQDYGWRSDHVLQADLRLPSGQYQDQAAIAEFYRVLTDRLRRLPGVDAASASYGLPYLGLRGAANVRAEVSEKTPRTHSMLNGVTADYFRVTGTRVVSGRTFTDADAASAAKVTIISESLARALFPGQPALGHRVSIAEDGPPDSMNIIGVVADTAPIDIAQSPNARQIYQAVAQDPRAAATVAIRTSGVRPETLAGAMRATIATLDPGVVIQELSSADALVGSITSQIAVVRQLLNAFAALGVFLAVIGIYGVMSRMIVQRTPEIGIRLALGAQVHGVLRLVAGAGLRVAVAGSLVGVFGAVALGRVLTSGFPSMHVNASVVLVGSVVSLLTVAGVVCLLSARRVTTISPVEALRVE